MSGITSGPLQTDTDMTDADFRPNFVHAHWKKNSTAVVSKTVHGRLYRSRIICYTVSDGSKIFDADIAVDFPIK